MSAAIALDAAPGRAASGPFLSGAEGGEAAGLIMRRPAIQEIHCRTVLNRVRPPMPFRWSANPYRGCQHAWGY